MGRYREFRSLRYGLITTPTCKRGPRHYTKSSNKNATLIHYKKAPCKNWASNVATKYIMLHELKIKVESAIG